MTISSQHIHHNDTVQEWVRKTNLLISDVGEFSVYFDESIDIAEQFAPIGIESDILTVNSGKLRKKNNITRIDGASLVVPSALAMVYIDTLDLVESPIKIISIAAQDGGNDIYDSQVAVYDGQVSFYINFTANPTTSVWLDGRELIYGATNDYTISGNTIILNNGNIVKIGSTFLAVAVDSTAYDALVGIFPIIKATKTSFHDIRTWSFINKPDGAVYKSAPAERFYTVSSQPRQIFNVGSVNITNNVVYVDGIRKTQGIDYYTPDEHTVVFFTPLSVGSRVIICGKLPSNEYELVSLHEEVIATTNGQTVFSLVEIPVSDTMAVWVDGIRQAPSTFSVNVSLNQLILSSGVASGALVIVGQNIPSSGEPYISGGVDGQIPVKTGIGRDEWAWQNPSFDSSSFSGIFPKTTVPIGGNIFTSPVDSTYGFDPYGMRTYTHSILNHFQTWTTNSVGSIEDFLFTGQTRNSVSHIGTNGDGRPYHEFFISMKCGRIFRNPEKSYRIDNNPVPNAPHTINAISTTRYPNGTTTPAIMQISGLVVGGDYGKMSFSQNVSDNLTKEASFLSWVDVPVKPFGSDWDVVDILPMALPDSDGLYNIFEYILVSAYDRVNNRSAVRFKKSSDLLNSGVAWINYIGGNAGITGKITKFAFCEKIWEDATTADSTPAAMCAIGSTIYYIDGYGATLADPLRTASETSIPSETIIDVFGVTNESRPNIGSGRRENRSWFVVTNSGKIYRKDTTPAGYYNPPSFMHWTQAKAFPYGKPKKITAIGQAKIKSTNNTTQNYALKYLVFFDGGVTQFGYSAAGSESYSILNNTPLCSLPNFVSFFDDYSTYDESQKSYMQYVIAQGNNGEICQIECSVSGNSVSSLRSYGELPFISKHNFIPPIAGSVVISNGDAKIFVGKPPINCVWVMTQTHTGGKCIPLVGDILGGFYERGFAGNLPQGAFIIVTTKYIYSSPDGEIWSSTQYNPSPLNREYIDISSSYINGKSIWVLANDTDSMVSSDGISWSQITSSLYPYRSVTSDFDTQIIATTKSGYIIQSQDGLDWKLVPNQTIDVFDVYLGGVIGTTNLQYDGITDGMKYTSVQAMNDVIFGGGRGFIFSRKNGHTIQYNTGTSNTVTEYIPSSLLSPEYDIFGDDPIVDLYGKLPVYGRTSKGKLWLCASAPSWVLVDIPNHSLDNPSSVSYDKNGNFYITSDTIGHTTGTFPQYYTSKF